LRESFIFLGVKWPVQEVYYWNPLFHVLCILRMSGVIPLLPLYAFMSWTWSNLPLLFTNHHIIDTISCILSYTMTEVSLLWLRFAFAFSSVVRQMPAYTSQRRGTARTLPISKRCCSLYCLCRFGCSMYCLCVNVYCTTATGCQPNCS